MAETNFKVFNEEMSEDKTYSDSEYEVATQRQTGVIPGMALSRLHNKMYRQISAMVKGIADFLVKEGFDAKDNDIPGITQSIKKAIKKITGDDITVHNTNATAHTDIRTKITNDITAHNTDDTAHADGIAGNAATATRLKPALTGSRNQCWLLCKLPKTATALVHYKILGAQYYDQYSTLEVAIKNGFGWCEYTGSSTNYQVSIKAYDSGTTIDVYLFAPNFCDTWELFLQKNDAVTEFNYKKVGIATYAPAGDLVCDTSSGLGMGGVNIFCGKRMATIDDVNAAGLNLLKRSTAYAVGDIAYSNLLPSWARLECVKAGTTANTNITTNTQAGQIITDGTATFIVDDVRDGHRVGNIILDHILRQGYVKANGAILQAADYPRLVQFVIDNNLSVTEAEWQASMSGMYVYNDTAKTLRVPDLRGVVLRSLDDGKGYDVGRRLGSYQADAIKSHDAPVANGWALSGFDDTGGAYIVNADISGYSYGSFVAKYSGGTETRPKNIALIAQIKY